MSGSIERRRKMIKTNLIKKITIVSFAFALVFSLIGPMKAQEKLQKSPGGYHGEWDFPISWNRYYAYPEWTKIMQDIQKKYPHLSAIQSIGKSRMGRDQYLITITAKSTGKDTEKPAMWVDGAVHGNEVNGISCSLYLMWYLLTRYDYDPYVHELVNDCTFYILPGLNVDANESYVSYPNTAHNPREPFRPEDNDGDGLYDEDRTEDVDGDGEISEMYIEDPKGDYKLSVDKRRWVRVDDPKEEVKRFRRLGQEGYDNDGDGMINEDDIGGPDPNRNYPAGWNLQAGNPYPMSEPCTRNAYTFQLEHTNIFASFH
ncbi:MAG: peptidase M14, partial [Candidatus Aminicenantes bacterium]|nr:peptidase M14 [Candidatus Aminicenantes bacterium]